MRTIYLFSVVLTFLILSGCRESDLLQNEGISVSSSELIGNWEAFEYQRPPDSTVFGEPSFMLYSTYCGAFELRENKEFALYYWRNGKPDEERVDGSWSIENDDELVFTFSGNWSRKVRITEFEGTSMEISELPEEEINWPPLGIFRMEKR